MSGNRKNRELTTCAVNFHVDDMIPESLVKILTEKSSLKEIKLQFGYGQNSYPNNLHGDPKIVVIDARLCGSQNSQAEEGYYLGDFKRLYTSMPNLKSLSMDISTSLIYAGQRGRLPILPFLQNHATFSPDEMLSSLESLTVDQTSLPSSHSEISQDSYFGIQSQKASVPKTNSRQLEKAAKLFKSFKFTLTSIAWKTALPGATIVRIFFHKMDNIDEFFGFNDDLFDSAEHNLNIFSDFQLDIFGDLDESLDFSGFEFLEPFDKHTIPELIPIPRFEGYNDLDTQITSTSTDDLFHGTECTSSSSNSQSSTADPPHHDLELPNLEADLQVSPVSKYQSAAEETHSKTQPLSANQKRKWEESIVVFSTNPEEKEIVPRRRKSFSGRRKKEVALQRKIGSCVQCKLKKLSCNFGIPCDYCVKRVGDIALGQQICTRRSLISIRFDHVDIFSIAKKRLLVERITSYQRVGEIRNIHLEFATKNTNTAKFSMKLPVVSFHDPGYITRVSRVSWNYYGFSEWELPDSKVAIDSPNLPTTEQLLTLYKSSRANVWASIDTGPFWGVEKAIREFVHTYCAGTGNLPLVVKNAFRLQELYSMYQTGLCMTEENMDGETYIINSYTMRMQITTIIAQDIIKLELLMLSEMDRVLYGAGGIGRGNALAMWLCLWALVFAYKEHMIMMSCWKSRERRTKYDLLRHIYDTLTSIYSALYKTTSPLTLDWRTEEVSELLGRDQELIRLFCNIKTEMYWLQTEMDSLRPEDNLFKTLVVENESRLLEAHKKAARKKGVL
ncbi:hypothetical protein G7Y89_g9391 [Cudoniella acicularis]|uniref:Zn(2)-C6 fungal-type domain-containing protein n=1 Tax=Cudoniella acicularis TaxID=354080 RepID=A0A8H4RIF9_9HELO|nr:hypothetical protein G7Y89_g9391 [Cudoniella acicularis]